MEKRKQVRKIGILGGGQLAMMLAEASVRLGIQPVIFSKSLSDPAQKIFGGVLGEIKDKIALQEFFSQVDRIIFENEFIDCTLLAEAVSQTSSLESFFFPKLSSIEILQDKLSQKEVFDDLQVPTSPWKRLNLDSLLQVQTEQAIENMVEKLSDQLHSVGPKVVLKWSRQGYDGKGVFVWDTRKSITSRSVFDFIQSGLSQGGEIYAEKWIPYKREFALIGVRTEDNFQAYPLMVSEQRDSICYRTYGPASLLPDHKPNSSLSESSAQEMAFAIAQKVGLYGTFALEFFEDESGQLLVNEVAPRVHNSGHYTQNADCIDQFENHIRSAIGIPIGRTEVSMPVIMLNLLGPKKCFGTATPPRIDENSFLHWYHKEETRPGRKLGHINQIINSDDKLESVLENLEKIESTWEKSFKSKEARNA